MLTNSVAVVAVLLAWWQPNTLAFLDPLGAILIAMGYWRRTGGFLRHAYSANVIVMCAGFMLIGYQLTGLFIS